MQRFACDHAGGAIHVAANRRAIRHPLASSTVRQSVMDENSPRLQPALRRDIETSRIAFLWTQRPRLTGGVADGHRPWPCGIITRHGSHEQEPIMKKPDDKNIRESDELIPISRLLYFS